jgi:hypothetical protein
MPPPYPPFQSVRTDTLIYQPDGQWQAASQIYIERDRQQQYIPKSILKVKTDERRARYDFLDVPKVAVEEGPSALLWVDEVERLVPEGESDESEPSTEGGWAKSSVPDSRENVDALSTNQSYYPVEEPRRQNSDSRVPELRSILVAPKLSDLRQTFAQVEGYMSSEAVFMWSAGVAEARSWEREVPPLEVEAAWPKEAEARHIEEEAAVLVMWSEAVAEARCWEREVPPHEVEAAWRKEAEARHIEEEATRNEEELIEEARPSIKDAGQPQVYARQTEVGTSIRESAIQKKEAEINIKELGVKRREADLHRREEEFRLKEAEAWRKEEEAAHRESDLRRREEEARQLEERAQQSLETAQRSELGARRAEAFVNMREAAAQKSEAEAKRTETIAKQREEELQIVGEQLRAKERQLQNREAELQRMLQAVDEQRKAINCQEDSLKQQLALVKGREENLSRKEHALTQPWHWQVAAQRQGKSTNRESDTFSLASTIRNDRHTNMSPSSKSISRLKEDLEYCSNEG